MTDQRHIAQSRLDKLYAEFGEQICLFPFFAGFYQTNQKLPSTRNSIRPCSMVTNGASPAWEVTGLINDTRNNNTWKSMRRDFINKSCNDIPACSVCRSNEKSGAESARQLNNYFFAEHLSIDLNTAVGDIVNNDYIVSSPLSLDYYPSNYCNYECIMCVGGASSKRNTFEIKYMNSTTEIATNSVDADFYNMLDAVQIINFTGGETLLQSQVTEVIDYLIAKNLAQNISITLLTNASAYPTELVDKFGKFKNVFYTISIDGVGKIIEYQRRGSKWDQVEKNAIKLGKDFGSLINFVLTAVSAFGLVEFLNWAQTHNMNRLCITPVFRSTYLSVDAIPTELKNEIVAQLTTAKDLLDPADKFLCYYEQALAILSNSVYNQYQHREFIRKIKIEDLASKQPLTEIVPQWLPYFENI